MKIKMNLWLAALFASAASVGATDPRCKLPANSENFSLITKEDASNAAHNVYTGVAVGGAYSDPKPNDNVVIEGASFIHEKIDPINVNFNGGVTYGGDALANAQINFEDFEWLAKNALPSDKNGNKVFVVTNGGTFNLFDFRPGGQGEDNGITLVIFDTAERVVLTKPPNDARPFGPSVIAPFAHVEVEDAAGFVDGMIVAKSFSTTGAEAQKLQLHGEVFKGANEMECKDPPEEPDNPGGKGDPHFKTWKNEHYEYHGQCDMILVKDPDFANGVGIEVQIRTKLVRYWSYIKSVAIRIGNEVIEVEGSDDPSQDLKYWYNLEYQADMTHISGFPVTISERGNTNYKRGLRIDLDSVYSGETIDISIWKEFIRVAFANASHRSFGKSVGLLGDFNSGKTLARDGVTELHDFWALGNEWQVLPFEDMLFHQSEEPQFPRKCIEPEDPQGERRRRLGESSVTEEQAEAACASLADEMDRKDCVYDILATQDLEMVGAY